MFWKDCSYFHFWNSYGEFVKVQGIETESLSEYWVYITKDQFVKLQEGDIFESVLEGQSEEDIRFLKTGEAPTKLLSASEKIVVHKAYVTNAVANSVVFYALMYLNNMGLSPNQIEGLRRKYRLGNPNHTKFFNVKEIRDSFINQSAFFMNLYSHMNENDRFEKFHKNLEQQKMFNEVFKFYANSEELKKHYDRRIFHNKFECSAMRNDYEEGTEFHLNTGVFAERSLNLQKDYYIVEMPYLEEIKMRVCRICEGSHSSQA